MQAGDISKVKRLKWGYASRIVDGEFSLDDAKQLFEVDYRMSVGLTGTQRTCIAALSITPISGSTSSSLRVPH